MLKGWLSLIAVLALAYSSASAQEVLVDIGLLTCGPGESAELESSNDALSGETRKMLCVFRPSNGPEEVYVGTYQTIGQDQVRWHNQAMIWVVKASLPTQRSSGLLQQLYAADRSAPSPHPPPLIGETNSTIVLQALADARVLDGADKQSNTGATIVLVALKLLSSLA
jgi:hypothetical protein